MAAVLIAALTVSVTNAGSASAEVAEQIPDGTFDSGPGQFTSYGADPAGVVDGQFCASVGANLTDPWSAAIERKGLVLVAGESYALKIKLNATPAGKFTLVLQDLGTFSGAASESFTLTGAAERTYSFVAGFGSTNMGLALQLGGFGSERNAEPYTLCIDDVSLAGAAPPEIEPPDPDEVLINSTFDDGASAPWTSYGGVGAGHYISDGRLCLDVPALPDNPYGAAIQWNGPELVQGFNYKLSFTARASIPVIVRTVAGRQVAPFETFIGAATSLVPANTDIEFSGVDWNFTPFLTMGNGQIAYQLGGSAQPFTFCVDNVTLVGNTEADVYAPDTGPRVRVNQVGYLPNGPKGATVVTEATTPVAWRVNDAQGRRVASGKTTPRGLDSSSQLNVHSVDFSSLRRTGTGFTLVADGETSHPFDISASLYQKLRTDALRLYYPQRSGEPIIDSIQPGYGRAAGHIGVAPNQGDTAVPCAAPKDANGDYVGARFCDYTLDVTGGWYDAGDHGKYVVNGGISVAQLLGTWERNKNARDTDRRALKDSTLAVPERGNGVPDILDEARVELEWLLTMQVPQGKPRAGMAHHAVHDQKWTGLPLAPALDPQPRELRPPSTAATLNLAAAAAQGARLIAPYDILFALKLWAASSAAWNAAIANPAVLSTPPGVGGGGYDDSTLTDEFYWAATELYLTTGAAKYRDYIMASPLHTSDVFRADGFDWGYVASLARVQLATVPNNLPDRARVKDSVVKGADKYLATLNASAWDLPYAPAGDNFAWGSNNLVLNNMVVIASAFDLTGKDKYRDGVIRGMDYLLGRNALNQSYVTGYGEVASHNQHSRMYSNQLNLSLPNPPVGTLAGGPNATAVAAGDPVAAQKLQGCIPQFCYIDDIGSWATNELTINWNSPLTWVASFLADQGDGD